MEEVGECDRFVLFPVKYELVWDMYKKAVASFWTVEEILSAMALWPCRSSSEQSLSFSRALIMGRRA